MDAFSFERQNVSSASTAVGILYAEDFDDLIDWPQTTSEPEPTSTSPALTQADVEAASASAVANAQRAWQASTEQAGLSALSSISETLLALRQTAERSTLDAAEATVSAILAIVCGVLPHFAAEHGPAEVRALLARLVPTLRAQERITVRVQPELVDQLKRDFSRLDAIDLETIEIIAADLAPGDVRVAWQQGSMIRDTKLLMQTVEDVLGELGLKRPTEAPAKRSMAYAD